MWRIIHDDIERGWGKWHLRVVGHNVRTVLALYVNSNDRAMASPPESAPVDRRV